MFSWVFSISAMTRWSLHRASAYHPPLLGGREIRCHHIRRPPEITAGGVFRVHFRLRRMLNSILLRCLHYWSHTQRASKSVQQSFPSSSVAPSTTKISPQAFTSLPRSFSVLQRWAFHSTLIYTFSAMTQIPLKMSNQSLERTPLGPPVLHGFTVHGVAQFGR